MLVLGRPQNHSFSAGEEVEGLHYPGRFTQLKIQTLMLGTAFFVFILVYNVTGMIIFSCSFSSFSSTRSTRDDPET